MAEDDLTDPPPERLKITFTQELEDERLDLMERDPEGYKTVWLGQCRASVDGAIYGPEIQHMQTQKRVRLVPVDLLLPVHTAWDIGWNDDTSIILWQKQASEVRIIGHVSGNRRTLADYVGQLNQLGYRWGTDLLPHDARAADIKTGKSTEEFLKTLGRRVLVLKQDNIEEGIRAARLIFPRLYIDEGCADLYNSLRRYRRQRSVTTGAFGPPLHDDSSHDADAFRYLAMGIDQVSNGTHVEKPIVYSRRFAA